MRALEFIAGHVIYNPAYTYKFQLKTTMVYMNKKKFQILIHLNKGQVPGPLCQTTALQTNETWTRDISLPKSWPQNNKSFRFHSY